MSAAHENRQGLARDWRGRATAWVRGLGALCCLTLAGCAALTNPVAEGIPAAALSPELRGPSREGEQPVPMSLFGQAQPLAYRLAPGDVLGVWVEGVLDAKMQLPEVRVPERLRRVPERGELPSGIGYPIPVRSDGTVSLPQLKPVVVKGLSVEEAEDAIRRAYVDADVLKLAAARVMVTLQHKRLHHVVVFRRDIPGRFENNVVVTRVGLVGGGGAELVGTGITGAGYEIDLPAYENDLLHALALTGGFPGTNAAREIVIYRNADYELPAIPVMPPGAPRARFGPPVLHGAPAEPRVLPPPRQAQPEWRPIPNHQPAPVALAKKVIRIPIRTHAGEPLTFAPEDVILQSGDTVLVEAAPVDTFYTGGLLPSAEHILPRDYDLDVLEAVTRVRGPLVNGAFGGSNLSGTLINPGIGNPSPKQLTVVRRLPNGGQIPILVDLHAALRSPEERILIQPGDVLVLQETKHQALVRYFTDVFQIDSAFRLLNRRDAMSTARFFVP